MGAQFFYANDVVLLLLRVLLGSFFVLARFRWFYDPSRPDNPWFNVERHKHLVWKLCTCHYPASPRLAAFVALTELSAGLGVIVGCLTNVAALGLFMTLVFATMCTAKEKVMEQKPVDRIDAVCDYLWRVEGGYIVIAFCLALAGGGAFSFDAIANAFLNPWPSFN